MSCYTHKSIIVKILHMKRTWKKSVSTKGNEKGKSQKESSPSVEIQPLLQASEHIHILSLGLRLWEKGEPAKEKPSTLLLTFCATLPLICLFLFWQLLLSVSSVPNKPIYLWSVKNDCMTRPHDHLLVYSGTVETASALRPFHVNGLWLLKHRSAAWP